MQPSPKADREQVFQFQLKMHLSVWKQDLNLISAAAACSIKKVVCKKLCYILFLKLFLGLEQPLTSHLHLETSRIRKRKK